MNPSSRDDPGAGMAHYLVTARPRQDRLADLEQKLHARAFAGLEPFGRSLTHGLENARLREDGDVVWEEEDYCTPPLREERVAALDDYFDHIRVEPVARGAGWRRIAELPRLFPALDE